MAALEHSARVTYARRALVDTEDEPADFDDAGAQRLQLRAALEQTLAYNDELLAIVADAVRSGYAAKEIAERMGRRP